MNYSLYLFDFLYLYDFFYYFVNSNNFWYLNDSLNNLFYDFFNLDDLGGYSKHF